MRTFLASTLLLLAAATGANAQILYGSFPLSGAQEVPPNGSANTGMANMSLNVATGVLTWSTSWTVPATAAHIHQAPVGGERRRHCQRRPGKPQHWLSDAQHH